MIGPFINSAAIVAGTLLGVLVANHLPERLRAGLMPTFALCAVAIGIHMLADIQYLAVIVMAFILGTAIGELLYFEKAVSKGAAAAQALMQKIFPMRSHLSGEEFSMQYNSLIVIFCASGLGILGSITEGLNGNYQLLLVKSMMDFLTAMIFAVSLGPSIALIFIAQLAVQSSLFLLATLIMPYMDEVAFADFSAVGGIIMIAVGMRMAGIMNFAVINFLPALFLVVPFSYVWRSLGFG
ncbi:MAG: hypothetical protein CMI02_04190 [Oceanospirillaceae bacterium]|nr:hypothetical protein [Oceanospirillaceae bacterium]MBT11217.1 hypothetical protein [Oceanospirillaceae bacterium]|tara:strand:+ start:63402 stop:64118 length:717 start_codon:yes stop_codon:yes gene_type:complete